MSEHLRRPGAKRKAAPNGGPYANTWNRRDGRRGSASRLQQGEDRFRTLIEYSSDIITILEPNGAIRYISPSIYRISGFSPEEIDTSTIFQLIHPDDVRSVTDAILRAVQNLGVPQAAQFRVRHRSGDWRYLEGVGRALVDEAGAPYGIINVRDVTERRLAEEALTESEARKGSVLETALDAILTIDERGTIVEFNPAAERIFGYSREEAVGQRMAELLVPPSLRERHYEGFSHYLATGEGNVIGKRIEITAMRADGSEFPVELAITRVPLDGPAMFTGYVRDITERKAAEAALRHSEEYFRTLLENAPDTITVIDPTGAIRYQSPAVERTVGYTPQEREGTSIFQIIHPEDVPAVSATIAGAVRKLGAPQSVRFRVRHKDGEWRHLEAVGTVVLDESGAPYGVINSRDVTERVKAEDALRQSEERNQQLMERALDVIIRINSNRGASRDSLIKGIQMLVGADSRVAGTLPTGILEAIEGGSDSIANDDERLSLLTERETQMLRFLCKGHTNKEIAAQMHYSVGTIKNMVQSVIEKLGVADRTQAAVYAVRAGIDIDIGELAVSGD